MEITTVVPDVPAGGVAAMARIEKDGVELPWRLGLTLSVDDVSAALAGDKLACAKIEGFGLAISRSILGRCGVEPWDKVYEKGA